MDKDTTTKYLDKISTLQELIQRVDPKNEVYKSTSKQLDDLKKKIEFAEQNPEEPSNVPKK